MAGLRAVVLVLSALPVLAGCIGAAPPKDAGAAPVVPSFGEGQAAAGCDGPRHGADAAVAAAKAAAGGRVPDARQGVGRGVPAAPAGRLQVPVPAGVPAPAAAAAPGLTTATLRTDAYGVTQIYADDAYTLFYANGYVQARDRLFEIHVLRHVGYGDSAAVAGSGQLASDLAVRRDLYSRDEIAQQLADAPPGVQAALRAYADGVNRFVAEAVAADALPGEFAALGPPEPWKAEDSVAAIDYLIGYFGSGGGDELANARRFASLEDHLGRKDAYAALGDLDWVRVDADAYTSIPAGDLRVDGCEAIVPFAQADLHQLDLAQAAAGAEPWGVAGGLLPEPVALGKHEGLGLMAGFKWGSNAMVLSGEHTTTGQPIMFGGPQMGYYKPPVPYQVGLHGAGFDAVGIGVAAAPGIVIGRTPRFAWSITSGADDQVDTIALPLAPGDDHAFVWDGATVPMQCRTETHRVLPSAAATGDRPQVVQQEVCRANGMPVVAWNPAAGVAWAQRMATRGKELDGAWMWLNVATCQDLACFMGQLQGFPFTFNFHYAGPEGIAYAHTGDAPLRDPALDIRLPALAGSAHAWRGEAVGLDLGTWVVNPSRGYAVNWNNAPAEGWRTGDTLEMWGSVHRVQLLDHVVQRRLAQGTPLAWQDVAGILEAAATHDPFARQVVPEFLKAAKGDAALAPQATALRDWAATDYAWADADGDGRYDDPGHAVYDAARLRLQSLVFDDELGPDALKLVFDPAASSDVHAGDHGRHDNRESTLVDALRGRTAHDWCDDVMTDVRETCTDMLRRSLADAAPQRMPIHHSRFTPIGGTDADEIPMVNRGSWNQVVAIGQGLDEAQGVLPPGNSGLVTGPELLLATLGASGDPPRVTDELGLYTAFAYKPLPVTPDEVAAVTVAEQALAVPAPVA